MYCTCVITEELFRRPKAYFISDLLVNAFTGFKVLWTVVYELRHLSLPYTANMSSTNGPPKSLPSYSSTNSFIRSTSLPSSTSTSGEKPDKKHSAKISNTYYPFGQCEQCKDSNTGYDWCKYCNSEYFRKNFTNWSSGNQELDNFIQIAQLQAINVRSILEWIEYKEFINVKHLADGGNSSV